MTFPLISILVTVTFLGCRDRITAPDRPDVPSHTARGSARMLPDPYRLLDQHTRHTPDSLYVDSSAYVYGINKVNGQHYAYFAITDSLLLLYQKKAEGWARVHATRFRAFAHDTQVEDLNNDGWEDFTINCICDAYANVYPTVYLFEPLSQGLKHAPAYEKNNIEKDKETGRIRVRRYSSAAHGQRKELYQPMGDTLVLLQGVEWLPGENPVGGSGTVNFYIPLGNKRIITRRYKGNKELLSVFEQALWQE